jgi:hypothetical protein
MSKLATKRVANLIEKDGVFILYNSSHTIIVKDQSLKEVYKKYKILEDQIEKEFLDSELNFDVSNNAGQSNFDGTYGKIKIEKSNKPTLILIVSLIALFLYFGFFLDSSRLTKNLTNGVKSVVFSTIQSLPATLKNTLLYTANGESWCYGCALEEVVDAINDGSSRMTPDDLERLRGKIETLKETYGFESK